MNKFFTLFFVLLGFLAIQNNFVLGTENVVPDQKTGRIKHVYTFNSGKFFKQKSYAILYVLENGFMIYQTSDSKKGHWQKKDKLIIQTSLNDFEDSDDEHFIHVKNKTKNEDSYFMAMGWVAPRLLKIVHKGFKRVDGDKVITLTLNDGTRWKIIYFDETAFAKKWQVGERVLLFIEPSAGNNAVNPFLSKSYSVEYTYGMINLDSGEPFACEPAYLAF